MIFAWFAAFALAAEPSPWAEPVPFVPAPLPGVSAPSEAPVAAPVHAATPAASSASVASASASAPVSAPSLARGKQPDDPYRAVDFTAYTLQQGEVRVGLSGLTVGVVPNVQVSTSPALDALRVVNGAVKVRAVHAGRSDLALQAGVYHFLGETMDATYVRGSATLSQQVRPGLSLHGGLGYAWMEGQGTPNLDPIAPYFELLAGWRPSEEEIAKAESGLDFAATAAFVSAKVAADYRFNRRDAVVLQGESMLWGRTALPTDVSETVTGSVPITAQGSGWVSPADAYMVSASYQASFRTVDLRVGIGASSVPGAWLLQSIQLDYRFGGATHRAERAQIVAQRAAERGATVLAESAAPIRTTVAAR